MGIIGFGNIGRAIARRASGFEMRVLAVDAEEVPPGEGVEEVWPLSRLDDLCRESDVLTISAPITPSSRGMVGPAQLKLLKRGSLLLQVSRGGICDETALIASVDRAFEFANATQANVAQADIFGDCEHGSATQEPELVDATPWGVKERLTYEKTAVGFYLSGR